MSKGLKTMLSILLGLIIVIGICAAGVWREFGDSPSMEEQEAYAKLSYYKNGQFQSPQKMVYDFNNVRNGPAGWARFLTRSPFAPKIKLPKMKLTKQSFSAQPSDFAFYWLGHSSGIMEIGGKRIIFDPVLGNAAPLPHAVPRYGDSPLKIEDFPKADYIVISHNHYDHLERKTIQKIKHGRFIVPLGVGAALRGWGIDRERIIELGWGESYLDDVLTITAETAVHYSGRGFGDRNKTLWNSYVLQSTGKNIYWSGDSGYGVHFAELGQKYGRFDLAIIEVDGWNTGWPNTHLFPEEAVRAAQELQTERFIPIHWAVFDLALHPWHESVDMLLEEAAKTDIAVMTPQMGEKIGLDTKTSQWWKNEDNQ